MNMLSLTVPVTALSATDMTLGERTAYAGEMTLIGMLTVFAVLALLWGAIAIMKLLMQGHGAQKAETVAPTSDTPAQNTAPVAPVPSPTSVPSGMDDAAVLAAITAAISVIWENEHPGTGFRVVSYRHIEKRSAWNIK